MTEDVHDDLLVVPLPDVDLIGIIFYVYDFLGQDVIEEQHEVLLVMAEDVLERPVAQQVNVGAGGNSDDKVFLLLLGEGAEAVILVEDGFVLGELPGCKIDVFHSMGGLKQLPQSYAKKMAPAIPGCRFCDYLKPTENYKKIF